MTGFESLGIREDILQNIQLLGFTDMTPIQEMALPLALEGKDVMGQAKTGTGKTFAFGIPLMEKIDIKKRFVQALVLTPTRELAVQVAEEFEKLVGSGVRVALAYGGASINPQIDRLRRGAHVVVGTPGRVMDHMRRGTLKINRIETFVLDEADRMLDMGFIGDMDKIAEKHQTLLFSATMPDEIRDLSHKYMTDPQFISANSDEDELTVGQIEQYYVVVDQNHKMDAFFKVVSDEDPDKALIFCKTKKWVETMHSIMRRRKFSVEKIHGDLTQAARKKAIEKLHKGKVKYLVCTDVVARGLHVSDISHVFNYDLPVEPLNYIHRIGRTGRAGKTGVAVSFINPSQRRDLELIEYRARTNIEERKIKFGKK